MTDKFEQDLAERIRELDQPIQIDAGELTSKLSSIRKQRRRQSSRNQLLVVVMIGCIVLLGFAFRLLPNGNEQPAVATNTATDDWKPISIALAEFDFPVDSSAQAAELGRLRAELAELKRASNAQKLTVVRESISRKMFSNDSTLSLFE